MKIYFALCLLVSAFLLSSCSDWDWETYYGPQWNEHRERLGTRLLPVDSRFVNRTFKFDKKPDYEEWQTARALPRGQNKWVMKVVKININNGKAINETDIFYGPLFRENEITGETCEKIRIICTFPVSEDDLPVFTAQFETKGAYFTPKDITFIEAQEVLKSWGLSYLGVPEAGE